MSFKFMLSHQQNNYVFPVCRYGVVDYLKIFNDNNYTVGKYCGLQSRLNITFTGRYAVLTFHSNDRDTSRGYKLDFSFFSPGKYKESDEILSKYSLK